MNILLFTFLILFQNQPTYRDSIPMSGWASYYAKKFTGRRTANGEIYNPEKYTCAHRTLPFGTVLKVVNSDNCKSVWVKVNDRGPYRKKRIIDLSLVAAKKLGIVKKGVGFVMLELPQFAENINPMDSVAQQYKEHKKSSVSKKRSKSVKRGTHKVSKKRQRKP